MISTKISCPKSYQRYLDRFSPFYRGSIRSAQAVAKFQFVDPVTANYDGSQFQLVDTFGVVTVFEWFLSPPPPPVPGVQYINLDLAVGVGAIAAATANVINGFATGYAYRASEADFVAGRFTVVQERAGVEGNTQIFVTGGAASTLLVNGVVSGSNSVYFYGGQSLLVPMLWGPQRGMGPTTFDTIQSEERPPSPDPVPLLTAGDYVTLAKTGITNVPASNITGNMGVSPAAAASITGFALVLDGGGTFSTSAQVTGQIFAADYAAPTPANLTQAVLDMQAAYTDAAGRVADFTEVSGGLIGGLSLVPGVYEWSTGVSIASNLTLVGGPADVFIFKIAGNLTIAAAQSIVLMGGVLPANVIWQVAGNVALGTTSDFSGIILCLTDITLLTGATFQGRLLSQTAVNFQSSLVTGP